MSNKSRGPGNRQPTLGDFAKRLSDAAAARAAAQEDSEESQDSGASGVLPLPNAQVIFPDRYEWVWEALPEEIHVTARMYRETKGWEVRLSCVDTNMRLTPPESKQLGEALLAAWNYEHIWKDGFADMFENGLEVKPLYTEQAKKAPAKKAPAKKALIAVDPPIDPDA